jgi:hypothetical protein
MVERFYCGEAPRQVTIREGAERQPLDTRFDLRRHSSNGFSWGEGSAESAHQLALALLADALRNDARAVSVHQDFSRRVIPLFLSVGRSRAVAYSLMSTGSKPSSSYICLGKPALSSNSGRICDAKICEVSTGVGHGLASDRAKLDRLQE